MMAFEFRPFGAPATPSNQQGFQFQTVAPEPAPAAIEPAPATPTNILGQPTTPMIEAFELGGGRQPFSREAPPPVDPRAASRLALEFGLSAAPGGAAVKFGRQLLKLGVRPGLVGFAGAPIGASTGSLLSETFDPTQDPVSTAAMAGAFTLAGEVGGLGLSSLLRRVAGRPTSEGQDLLTVLDNYYLHTGKQLIPPAGTVMPEGSMTSVLESIGRVDAVYGSRLREIADQAAEAGTYEIRRVMADYLRFKRTADGAFKQWDELTKARLGDSRVVKMPAEVVNAVEPIVREWERTGIISKLDNTLVEVVNVLKPLLDDAAKKGTPIKEVKFSMREAEALRTLLFDHARLKAFQESGSVGGKKVGSITPSSAFRSFAEDAGKGIDDAIETAIKDGRMPPEARATLKDARVMWKQWKQGEAVVDELWTAVKGARQAGAPLNSEAVFGALRRLEEQGRRVGRPIIGSVEAANLAKIGRALAVLEQRGTTSAFQYSVRAGQAIAATGTLMGQITGQTAGLALTPTGVAWLMSNKHVADLFVKGMLAPTTAEAVRAMRRFVVLGAKDGIFAPPQRLEAETPEGAVTGTANP